LARTLNVIAAASATIRLVGIATAAADKITNATIGVCIRLKAMYAAKWSQNLRQEPERGVEIYMWA
jgi:hypothetical protein